MVRWTAICMAGVPWEITLEEVLLQEDWERVPSVKCIYFHRQGELFLSLHVDDKKHGWEGRGSQPSPYEVDIEEKD